jgi:hypothetical protein
LSCCSACSAIVGGHDVPPADDAEEGSIGSSDSGPTPPRITDPAGRANVDAADGFGCQGERQLTGTFLMHHVTATPSRFPRLVLLVAFVFFRTSF